MAYEAPLKAFLDALKGLTLNDAAQANINEEVEKAMGLAEAKEVPETSAGKTPGGSSQISFSDDGSAPNSSSKGKTPGGSSQISFSDDGTAPNSSSKGKTPGGSSQISFGGSDEAPPVTTGRAQGKTPGGTSQINFGGSEEPNSSATTGRAQGKTPGGSSQISFGESNQPASNKGSGRAPGKTPGGSSSIWLGDDSQPAPPDPNSNSSRVERAKKAAAELDAQAAQGLGPKVKTLSRGVAQAPGGSSQINFNDEGTAPVAKSTSAGKTPGGTSQINFGGSDEAAPSASTGRAQGKTPGGTSQINFGGSEEPAPSATTGRAQGKTPGGTSQISFGTSNEQPAPTTTGRAQGKTPGGTSQINFGGSEGTQNEQQRSSTKLHAPPGGLTSISLGSEAVSVKETKEPTSLSEGEELEKIRLELSNVVYRKGKPKDIFAKFTLNKSKNIMEEDLKNGIISIGGLKITDAQVKELYTKYAKNPADGIDFSSFVKLLTV